MAGPGEVGGHNDEAFVNEIRALIEEDQEDPLTLPSFEDMVRSRKGALW